jgi:CheY-like chemotaxis protein
MYASGICVLAERSLVIARHPCGDYIPDRCKCFPYGQAQDSTGDMDRLLQQQRHVELELALATTAADLPSSDLMFFKGVMANRTNQEQKSSD